MTRSKKRKPDAAPKRRKRAPVHDNILRLREGLKLTQEQLATKVGSDKTRVSHWERAKCSPNAEVLPALAACLGVTVDELLAEQAA